MTHIGHVYQIKIKQVFTELSLSYKRFDFSRVAFRNLNDYFQLLTIFFEKIKNNRYFDSLLTICYKIQKKKNVTNLF